MHQNLRRPAAAQKIDDDVKPLRVQTRWSVEILSCGSRSGENEDARTDDRADPQSGERPRSKRFLQALARRFGFRDQLVNRLAEKKLLFKGGDTGGGFVR